MNSQKFDRMALNAAMDLLASGREDGWLVAAEQIIAFGTTLPQCLDVQHKAVRMNTSKGNEKVTGYAEGHGTVDYKDEKKPTLTTSMNEEPERIGSYRVLHNAAKRQIWFQHYRALWDFKRWLDDVHDGGYAILYTVERRPRVFMRVELVKSKPPWNYFLRVHLVKAMAEIGFYMRAFMRFFRTGSFPKIVPWFSVVEPRFIVIHSAEQGIQSGDRFFRGHKIK